MKAPLSRNLGYNKKLKPLANHLRHRMTKAEACLWKYVLRARSLKGYPFRRQRPVLKYIADFLCKELMLIIEVDGITHTYEEVRKQDEKKQHDLKEAGFTVIRFADEEVLQNINGVVVALEQVVYNLEKDKEQNSSPVRTTDR